MVVRKWKFFEYQDGEKRRDSSSAKHFKGQKLVKSIVREFTQNSLDAEDNDEKPVRVSVSSRKISYEKIKHYIEDLRRHLKACEIGTKELEEGAIDFLILEDFNTKGLEGDNLANFFERDNITDKNNTSKSGGSHGIGKINFYEASKIKTFFGFSIFNENNQLKEELRGTCNLKTHEIDKTEYKEDGELRLDEKEDIDFFKDSLFKRGEEKGLSVAIPLTKENDIKEIEDVFLQECYYPIVNKKLRIEINNKVIDDSGLLEHIDNPKIKLLLDYITTSNVVSYKEKLDYKSTELKLQNEEEIIKYIKDNGKVFINFSIDIHIKKPQKSRQNGKLTLLVGKNETSDKQRYDFWRGNLLINKAAKRSFESDGYLVITIVNDDHLYGLLRKLEDPGHTTWEYSNPNDKVKEIYKNIQKMVPCITQLPSKVVNLIKHQHIESDANFFSDYFPDGNSKGKKALEGSSTKKEEKQDIPLVNHNSKFKYRESRKNNGFIISFNEDLGEEEIPSKVKIRAAYGTNKGNPFNNYSKKDFDFEENIEIRLNNGKQLEKDGNQIVCKIKNKDFKISLYKFDPDRELKINIQDES